LFFANGPYRCIQTHRPVGAAEAKQGREALLNRAGRSQGVSLVAGAGDHAITEL
jgi:hypothetical protein